MQNPSMNEKGQAKQLHQVTDKVREATDQIASDFSSKARDMASDTADRAGQYYSKASSWLDQNRGMAFSLIGLVAASGVIGYFLGRSGNSDRSPMQSPLHHS